MDDATVLEQKSFHTERKITRGGITVTSVEAGDQNPVLYKIHYGLPVHILRLHKSWRDAWGYHRPCHVLYSGGDTHLIGHVCIDEILLYYTFLDNRGIFGGDTLRVKQP